MSIEGEVHVKHLEDKFTRSREGGSNLLQHGQVLFTAVCFSKPVSHGGMNGPVSATTLRPSNDNRTSRRRIRRCQPSSSAIMTCRRPTWRSAAAGPSTRRPTCEVLARVRATGRTVRAHPGYPVVGIVRGGPSVGIVAVCVCGEGRGGWLLV